jgi:pyruvate dehydrogenase (quinone)
MSILVAGQIIETLKAAGVKRIYGIVGDSLNGITDALRNSGIEWFTLDTKRWLHSRQAPRLT